MGIKWGRTGKGQNWKGRNGKTPYSADRKSVALSTELHLPTTCMPITGARNFSGLD
jgi:hypothetical protein